MMRAIGRLHIMLLLGAGLALFATAVPRVKAQGDDQRRVFTYFYYWYEPQSDDPRSLADQAALSNHFPPDRPGDWRSAHWFKEQLTDMHAAGVDVALAVYWGDDLYPGTVWSTGGLEHLVQALNELEDEGQTHPSVGLFLDTYVLDGARLDDPEKLEWLESQVTAFFMRVPERHWARQDGRPIIWLYVSNFANSFDQDAFDRLSASLEEELGASPFWVAETSWVHVTRIDEEGRRYHEPEQPLTFDAYYRWGAASRGALFVDQPLPIVSVGPGYDDSAILERGDQRSDRPRETGCFYARSWRKAQVLGASWVVIETWNELYEGSGVAETFEWGRYYVELTGLYSSAHKQNEPITLPPECLEVEDEEEAPSPGELAEPAEPAESLLESQPDSKADPCPGGRKKKRSQRRPSTRCS